MVKYKHIVTKEEEGLTINQILKANYSFSARFKTKMKYQSLVDLNDVQTPGYVKPKVGDVISIRLPDERSNFEPEDIPLDIIYEDEDLIIINKQAGITVHPTKGHPNHTLANAVTNYMLKKGDSYKIRFANRLDTDTSGLVIVAKNGNAQNEISKQMRNKTINKEYLALVNGIVNEDNFIVDLPIGRPYPDKVERAVMKSGGKEAKTGVRVLERFDSGYTYLSLELFTGRTHQIRVHLSHIGHPILGDALYGGQNYDLIKRQALHACSISFDHPINGERMTFKSEPPSDMTSLIYLLR